MSLILLKKILSSSSWQKNIILTCVCSIEICLWLFGRLYPMDSEIYFSLSSPIAIVGGSLPLMVLILAIYLKDTPLLEQTRVSKKLEFRARLLLISLTSFVVAAIPIILSILIALFSQKTYFLHIQIMVEIFIRHFMFLATLGLIQYLGVLFLKNKYIIPILIIASFGSLAFMPRYKFVEYLFIFVMPPVDGKGASVVPLFLLFSGLILLLMSLCYHLTMSQDNLGGTHDSRD